MELTVAQKWGLGITGGVLFLLVIKNYFAGGKCKIQKNLSRKLAVVTGGNTGIGKQTARKLVQMGCDVIIGARDLKKNQATVEQLSQLKKGDILAFSLDLSKKQSIEQFARKVLNELGDKPIDYLVNNAGVMMLPKHTKTDLGSEFQLGVNHLGHFYLTYLLWQKIRDAQAPRIINVSSRAHIRPDKRAQIKFDDFAFDTQQYNPMSAYSRSKKANILFTKQLQNKMDENKINGISLSLHPGVVRTELARQILNSVIKRLIAAFVLTLPSLIFMKSSLEGAQTTLYTLLEEQNKLQKGCYYSDCAKGVIQTEQCNDPNAPSQLWKASEKYWNIRFNL